ncbi:MAG TPA: flagellar cap protein FliD N-terminal domain-containing protein, partial [Candidatus Cybelea sp.]|nr:flagellar cap protein FliD N-terminal domain-containing protein [Candidatus Cybelea sp.]
MSTNSVPGTNVPPISFPGIVSGVDYNSIIKQLTSLSLAPTVSLNAAIATLNNANAELIKINSLLISVQNSLQNLSETNLYGSYDATSSDTTAAIASGTTGVAAVPGIYTIDKVQTATATTDASSATAGHSITDGGSDSAVPLAQSYASVTPSNGGSLGQVTVDGVTIS